jgi:peptidoglycan/LPS O-acetylase OafA/YrhL
MSAVWTPTASRPLAASVSPPAVAPPPGQHIPALDAIRGLAIIAVTLYRFRAADFAAATGNAWFANGLDLGQRGVDLFFVLSGFLITGILFDAKQHPHYFRNFYARRSLRIFPLYFGVLAAALLLLPLIASGTTLFAQARDLQGWLWLYGTNLLMAWRGEWCFGAFDHFWSLAIEEHFYLAWPLVIWFTSRTTAMRICATIAVLSGLARIGWLALGGNGPAASVFTLFHLDALLVGAWLALAARSPDGLTRLVPWCRLALLVGLVGILPEALLQQRLLTIPSSFYACFFGALIVLAITADPRGRWARFWNTKSLRWFGKYSYAMYVFQPLLIPLLGTWWSVESLYRGSGSPLAAQLIYLVLMFAATTAAAVLSWHLYEKRFLRWKRYFVAVPARA